MFEEVILLLGCLSNGVQGWHERRLRTVTETATAGKKQWGSARYEVTEGNKQTNHQNYLFRNMKLLWLFY